VVAIERNHFCIGRLSQLALLAGRYELILGRQHHADRRAQRWGEWSRIELGNGTTRLRHMPRIVAPPLGYQPSEVFAQRVTAGHSSRKDETDRARPDEASRDGPKPA